METKKGIVFNIQRFTIHDGPGIRTEVFLKGCPLHCKWCSNPESIDPRREVGVYHDRCMGSNVCGSCLEACPLGGAPLLFRQDDFKIGAIDRSICKSCMKCTDACVLHALKSWGTEMTVDEVMKEVVADKNFYANSGGGITISGGEATMQWEFVLELAKACKREHIHVCLESSMQCSDSVLDALLPHCDMIISDIKSMDSAVHKEWCGVGNERILRNIEKVVQFGMPTVLRLPAVPGVNDSEENFRATAAFIRDTLHNHILQLQILPYLRMGEEKYHSLGQDYRFDLPVDELKVREPYLRSMTEIVHTYGVPVVYGSAEKIEGGSVQ